MKTKIVHYIGRIQDGGAETLVKDYALLLDANRFDLTILCDDYKKQSANYKILKEKNIRIVSLFNKYQVICKILRRFFGGKFRALLFDNAIEEINPEIVHVHLESLETLRYSKKLRNVKVFYTCHNLPQMMIGNGNKIENEAARYLLNKNHIRFIALHDDMANEINNMFQINNTAVIKNAINLDKFNNVIETKNEIRLALGIDENSYVIGNIGRFSYQKNHDFILKIFSEVIKQKDNAHLLLVGDGKLKKSIQDKIKQLGLSTKVTILSNRKDIPQLLKAMDVFLFPSRFEGLGIVLIEAQASKLSCVVSDAIPYEAYRSNLITEISLKSDIKTWVSQCINPKSNVNEYGGIDDYDINKEIKKLEQLYLS